MPSCWTRGRYSPRIHPLGYSGLTVSKCSTFSSHPFSVYVCEWCDNGLCPHHFIPLGVYAHTHFPLCCMFLCEFLWVSPSPVQIHVMFPRCGLIQHVMLHSALYVQREPFCVPSLNVCIVFGMLRATCMGCCWCSNDDILIIHCRVGTSLWWCSLLNWHLCGYHDTLEKT